HRPRSAVSRARRASPDRLEGATRLAREARLEAAGPPLSRRNRLGSSRLAGVGHVPVETITFVAPLRPHEMVAPRVFEGRGQERRNVLACVAHCLGPELRGAITFEKMVIREAWRRTSGPRSALDPV